jgi:hypothetical protein
LKTRVGATVYDLPVTARLSMMPPGSGGDRRVGTTEYVLLALVILVPLVIAVAVTLWSIEQARYRPKRGRRPRPAARPEPDGSPPANDSSPTA